MRVFCLTSLVLLTLSVAHSQQDSVFTRFSGDTLIVWDANVRANCASRFYFSIGWLDSDGIVLAEVDTVGPKANCSCTLDLSIAFLGLGTEYFTVDVYRAYRVRYGYPRDTTVHIGSTGFTIHDSGTGSYSELQRQSACREFSIAQYDVLARWNLVSTPMVMCDIRKSALYPTAGSNAYLYSVGKGYVSMDTLVPGNGYWLRFGSPQSVVLNGIPLDSLSLTLSKGWNLIGSVAVTVAVSSVSTIPPGMVSSDFFGYGGGYATTDTLYPGKGYWVKVNEAGKMILSSAGSGSAASRIRIMPTGELPPAPPVVNETPSIIPGTYALEQNYPNPFNPATMISYQLPVASYVTLKVYNMLGQGVATLVDDFKQPGRYSVQWDGPNAASGLYFYRLTAGDFLEVKKLLLLR